MPSRWSSERRAAGERGGQLDAAERRHPRSAGVRSPSSRRKAGLLSAALACALTLSTQAGAASQGAEMVATAIEAYAASSAECFYRPEVSGTLRQLEEFFSDQAGDEWEPLRADARRQLAVAINVGALASKDPYHVSTRQRCGVYGPIIGQALLLSVAVIKPDRVIVAEAERLNKGGSRPGSGPPLPSTLTAEPTVETPADTVPPKREQPPEIELTCPEDADFDRTSRSAQQFVAALQSAHPGPAEVSTVMDQWSEVLAAHRCLIPAKRGSFFEIPREFQGRWSTSAQAGKCGGWEHTIVTDDTLLMKNDSRCGVAHHFGTSGTDSIDVVLFCTDKTHAFNLNGRWSIQSAQGHRTFSEQYLPADHPLTAEECSG